MSAAVESAGEIEIGIADDRTVGINISHNSKVGVGSGFDLPETSHSADFIRIRDCAVSGLEECQGQIEIGSGILPVPRNLVYIDSGKFGVFITDIEQRDRYESAFLLIGAESYKTTLFGVGAYNRELLMVGGSGVVTAFHEHHIFTVRIKIEEIGVISLHTGIYLRVVNVLSHVDIVDLHNIAIRRSEHHIDVAVAGGI